MDEVLQMLDTLPDEDLRNLITRAQAILRERARKVQLSADPAIGMWKDRQDIQDSTAWVRELRQREWR